MSPNQQSCDLNIPETLLTKNSEKERGTKSMGCNSMATAGTWTAHGNKSKQLTIENIHIYITMVINL